MYPVSPSDPAISITIDRTSVVPLYQQIHDSIRDAIQDGRLPAGARLPSTRLLAAKLSVSRRTVLVAFEQLLTEGLVRGHAGDGTRVCAQAEPKRD